MSCAKSTLKFSTIVLSLLCCIIGALMLSASAYALARFDPADAIRVPCILGVVIGSLLFLTNISGFIAAIRETTRGLWIFAVVLLLLMLAQVAINLLFPVDFKQLAQQTVNLAWNREISNQTSGMSTYEVKYHCCGKNSAADYIESGLRIPPSCYEHQNATVAMSLYPRGCVGVLADMFSSGSQIEEISDWSLVGFEGLTIIVACVLAVTLNNMQRRKLYH